MQTFCANILSLLTIGLTISYQARIVLGAPSLPSDSRNTAAQPSELDGSYSTQQSDPMTE
ncbi:hypothetical protein H4R33_006555, partial [Dimargaris cristalligena]